MSNLDTPETDFGCSMIYQIRVRGHLDSRWADWFEGMTITLEEGGETVITGLVADQAQLHGLLRKVRNLGLPLLSIQCTEATEPGTDR